jgi:DivIVA domain-containing protein
MDWSDIERLRSPGFTLARRGYDQREVDRFLDGLADWLETDAANDVAELAAKRKLELVGKSTSNILMTAQQEAEEIRREAQQQGAEILAAAEERARQATEAGEERAKRTVEEGERRRESIEAVVSDLEARRAEALKELERLSDELTAAIEAHRAAQPAV